MSSAEAADYVAIAQLIDAFAVLLDEAMGTYPFKFEDEPTRKLLALFAKDGVIHSPFGRGEGHDGMVAMWKGVGQSTSTGPSPKYIHHHMTSKHIEVTGETATAVSYVLSVSDKGLDSWGRYDDTFVKLEDGWRFSERLVIVTDSATGSWYEGVPDLHNPTES